MTWESLRPGLITGYLWHARGALRGQDPYLAWLDATGPDRHFPLQRYGGRLPMALVAPKPIDIARLVEAGFAAVPAAYMEAMTRQPADRPFRCTARVEPSKEALGALRERGVRMDLGLPQRVACADDKVPVAATLPGGVASGTYDAAADVVIGIIDDGCAFAHEQFCWKGRDDVRHTRVEWLWDQGEEASSSSGTWTRPADFGYGREANQFRLDALMAEAASVAPAAIEDISYARAPHVLPADRASHGVAVMSLAAASRNPLAPDTPDAASKARIIFVQLPRQAVDDTSAGWLSVHVQDAVNYIARRAGSRPTVINLSFGGQAGPHDGTSVLEEALDDYLLQANRAIVVAAGNGFADGCHAHAELQQDTSTCELGWWLEPDDPSDSFLEIRARNAKGPAPISVRVTPFGEAGDSDLIGPGHGRVWRRGGATVAAVFNQTDGPPDASTARRESDAMVLVCVAPTLPAADGRGERAPWGPWKIVVESAGEVSIDAWIERDDSPFGKRRLKQSRFHGPAVTDRDTLSSVASGRRTIVVGGYRLSDGSMAPYSASGPTRDRDPRNGITLVAPSERSAQRPSLQVPGPRSGTRSALAGTSLAAPVVTRAVAEILAGTRDGPALTADEIKQRVLPPPPLLPAGVKDAPVRDVNRYGAGRLVTTPAAVAA